MARMRRLTITIANDSAGRPYVDIVGRGKGNPPEFETLEFKMWADEIVVDDRRPRDES